MFVNKEKKFKIIISSSRQIGLYKFLIDYNIKIGDTIEVPWHILKTSSFRREKIELICDDCGKYFTSRLQNLDENNEQHFCGGCRQKGNKHYNYGKHINENTKEGLKRWHRNNINPAKRKNVKDKISKSRKGKPSNNPNGIEFHSNKTKEKISTSVKKAWKEGKYKKIQDTFGHIDIKKYKGVDYQGTYELKFLVYIEEKGYLDKIERGPKIKYIDKQGNTKIYFSDFRLKDSNIIFEIKSTYFLELHKENYLLKESAAIKKYDYNLVLDNNFDIVDKKLNEYNIRT